MIPTELKSNKNSKQMDRYYIFTIKGI